VLVAGSLLLLFGRWGRAPVRTTTSEALIGATAVAVVTLTILALFSTVGGSPFVVVSCADREAVGAHFKSHQGTESGFDIFVMNTDGSGVRRVTTTGHDYDPHRSPDGTRIALTRQEGPMQSDIFVMAADGSNVLRLTDGSPGMTNLDPEWSPDGSKIAYVAGKTGGPGGLVVMNVDGSDPVTLVPDGVLGISWQPLPAITSPTPTGHPGGGSGKA
jgi:dipeptidyl aminopeptidase/acylaminoacyl peptidase